MRWRWFVARYSKVSLLFCCECKNVDCTLAVIAIGTIFAFKVTVPFAVTVTVLLAVPVLHVAVTVVGAPSAVSVATVTAIVVTITVWTVRTVATVALAVVVITATLAPRRSC